jgi:hypothetical protein
MYKVPYGSKGPEKDKHGVFCTAGMRCKKCNWFVKKTVSSYILGGKKITRQTTICGFNKKPYSDMTHNLFVYSSEK